MSLESFIAQRLARRGMILALALVVAVAVVGCGGQAQRDDSAANLMPNLPDYNVANTLDIQETVTKLVGGAALAAAQPQITGLVAAAGALAKCYQEAGAVEGRVYTKKDNAFKAGLVVIVNRNKLLDPATLLNCLGGQRGMSVMGAIQPCAKIYALPKGNNEFYIAYVGTNPEVCDAFCSALEGCRAAP